MNDPDARFLEATLGLPAGSVVPLEELPSAEELVREGAGMISVTEAAKILRIDEATVRAALTEGWLQGRQVGSTWIVDAGSVRDKSQG